MKLICPRGKIKSLSHEIYPAVALSLKFRSDDQMQKGKKGKHLSWILKIIKTAKNDNKM